MVTRQMGMLLDLEWGANCAALESNNSDYLYSNVDRFTQKLLYIILKGLNNDLFNIPGTYFFLVL